MVTEGRHSKGSIAVSHGNAELLEFSFMADYLDECVDGSAEKVPCKTFEVETKKHIPVVSVSGVLLQTGREFSKRFLGEVLEFFIRPF